MLNCLGGRDKPGGLLSVSVERGCHRVVEHDTPVAEVEEHGGETFAIEDPKYPQLFGESFVLANRRGRHTRTVALGSQEPDQHESVRSRNPRCLAPILDDRPMLEGPIQSQSLDLISEQQSQSFVSHSGYLP